MNFIIHISASKINKDYLTIQSFSGSDPCRYRAAIYLRGDRPSVASALHIFVESVPSTTCSLVLAGLSRGYWAPSILSSCHDTPTCLEHCSARLGRWWSRIWVSSFLCWGHSSLLHLINVRNCWGSSQTYREQILLGN